MNTDQNSENKKKLLSDLIKKQIIIFGQDITALQLKDIPGLQVDEVGNVTSIPEDVSSIEKKLFAAWHTLSPFLAKKIAEPTFS